MSSDSYDSGDAAPKRSSGAPTWLIILLSVLLVLGLVCVGGIALMVYGVRTAIDSAGESQVQSNLRELYGLVQQYHAEKAVYPETLKEIEAFNTYGYSTFYDHRDTKQTPLIYLPPAANSAPTDVLAHTSRTGPQPILAVLFNGSLTEYKTAAKLEDALFNQNTRPVPDEPPTLPGPVPHSNPAPAPAPAPAPGDDRDY